MDNNNNKDNTDKKNNIPSYEEFDGMITKLRNKLTESIKNNNKHRRTKSLFDEFDTKVKNVSSGRKKILKIKFNFNDLKYVSLTTMRTTIGNSVTYRERSQRSKVKENAEVRMYYDRNYYTDRLNEFNKKLFAGMKNRNRFVDEFYIGWK